MTDTSRKTRRDLDPELRERARSAYRELGTYRAAAKHLGLTVSRVHALVNEPKGDD